MTSLRLREPTSLLTDLVSGMQIVTNDPEIRIKEYVVGDQHIVRRPPRVTRTTTSTSASKAGGFGCAGSDVRSVPAAEPASGEPVGADLGQAPNHEGGQGTWARRRSIAMADTVDALRDRPGLTSSEAARLLSAHGRNELPAEPGPTIVSRVRHQLRDPMILLLCGAFVLVVAVGDRPDAAIIAAVVVLNTVIGVVQDVQGPARGGRSLADGGSGGPSLA